jgi:aryl-alcohol dehydrogenase-like predicted oxidoreductase
MEYVRLGNSGLKVSRLSLGAMGLGSKAWRSWVLEYDQALPLVKRALDHGINLIDTCNFYSGGTSEELIGRLLKDTIKRDEVIIATKFGFTMGPSPNQRGYSRKHIIEAVDGSLRRLGTDYIDLYQTHIWDEETNIEEMMEGLAHVVRQGKVLYIGATDIPAWQLAKAIFSARAALGPSFVSLQYHYNMIWREAEREMMPLCRDQGIALLPYSPIARGFLSGRVRREGGGKTERAKTDNYAREWFGRPADERALDVAADVASKHGITTSQLAVAWVLHQPGITSPIFGATEMSHLESAIGALSVRLDAEDMKRLDETYEARRTAGHS